MSSKIYDPETKKEYVCENEFDYRIQRFCELNQYVKHEEEVIEFAFSLRDKLINDLEDENDTIRLKYIKWIEDEYLLAMKDFIIQHELNVPDNINNFKAFKYKCNKKKNKGGRPRGKSQITKQRHNWIRDKYAILMNRRSGSTKKEFAKLIFSELQEKTPPYFNKPYELSQILKVLKEESWSKK